MKTYRVIRSNYSNRVGALMIEHKPWQHIEYLDHAGQFCDSYDIGNYSDGAFELAWSILGDWYGRNCDFIPKDLPYRFLHMLAGIKVAPGEHADFDEQFMNEWLAEQLTNQQGAVA